MRRVVTVAGVVAMAIGVAACGGKSSSSTSGSAKHPTTTTSVPASSATTGAAASGTAATSGCSQLSSTLTSIETSLPNAAAHPSTFAHAIAGYVSKLETEAKSTSPAVQTAVHHFVVDLEAAGKGKVNVTALTSAANGILAACGSSSGASSSSGG